MFDKVYFLRLRIIRIFKFTSETSLHGYNTYVWRAQCSKTISYGIHSHNNCLNYVVLLLQFILKIALESFIRTVYHRFSLVSLL